MRLVGRFWNTRTAISYPGRWRLLCHAYDWAMNAEHLELLKRQALSKPTDSAGLLLKAKALDEMVRRLDLKSVPAALGACKEQLLEVILLGDRIGTARAQSASSMAGRTLDRLEALEAEPEPPSPADDPFWELDLTTNMVHALDWSIEPPEWREGSPRVRRLVEDAERILDADDPLAVFNAWCGENGVAPPPERIIVPAYTEEPPGGR
jgi:hypothetical protein